MPLSLAIDSFTAAESCRPTHGGGAAAARRKSLAVEAANLLRAAFGVDFTVIDGNTGDVLHLAADQPCREWSVRAELCQEVARRGKPAFVEEDFPLALLAVPVAHPSGGLVGVATFVTRSLETEPELARAASFLRCGLQEARDWSTRQSSVSGEMLERLANLVQGRWDAEQRIQTLEGEVENLSRHVASTYEEISLIYRLTQNLRISANEADLGRVALEWLAEIMPFEGVALQLLPKQSSSQNGESEPGDEPCLLTYSRCPLDNDAFSRLVQELEVRWDGRPVVINRTASSRGSWSFPQVRQLILLPIGDGEQLFGYLAAFNHTADREFGTSEADLLSSVAAILGIHSGNAELYRQQAELLSGIVRALTSAIDAKDPYTCGHSDRVARVAVRLAEEMGCNQKTVETIYLAGLLHDVGKIGIDDEVLRKPGKLTAAEFEHIKTHARIGHNILIDLKQLDRVLPVVLHHHESWDGSGYPDGLAGEQIPPLARIVAVADAFDAMKSDRPYRQGMADDKLDEIIRKGAGQQWDASVVDAYFRAREDIREIAQRESDDGPLQLPHYM